MTLECKWCSETIKKTGNNWLHVTGMQATKGTCALEPYGNYHAEPIPDMEDDELGEAYEQCWCEQDAQYPESYKEDHMIYLPYNEGFSPFAAFVSVIMLSLLICLIVSLVS